MNSYLLKRKVCSLLRVKPGRDFEVAFRDLSIVRVRKEDEFLKLRRDNVIFFHPLEKLKHALQIMYIIFMIFALPLFFALSAMTENILIVGGTLYAWQHLIRCEIPWPLYAIINWKENFLLKIK